MFLQYLILVLPDIYYKPNIFTATDPGIASETMRTSAKWLTLFWPSQVNLALSVHSIACYVVTWIYSIVAEIKYQVLERKYQY